MPTLIFFAIMSSFNELLYLMGLLIFKLSHTTFSLSSLFKFSNFSIDVIRKRWYIYWLGFLGKKMGE